jgi:hypothetical protein
LIGKEKRIVQINVFRHPFSFLQLLVVERIKKEQKRRDKNVRSTLLWFWGYCGGVGQKVEESATKKRKQDQNNSATGYFDKAKSAEK